MLDHLFSPITIGGTTFKNRCAVPAMVTDYCTRDGKATERFIAYHEEKARGGWGLIITEDYAVDPEGRGFTHVAGLWNDDQIEGHSALPARVHKYGAKIFAQIYHCGRQTRREVNQGEVRAPSAIPCPYSPDMPVPLTTKEVLELIEKFGDCALRAQKCGFDGVEIHGGHGYLIAQFMAAYSNKRTDMFGGSFENRIRFPVEIIRNIRKKCGNDFIIDFRISADEFIDGGRTMEDTKAVVRELIRAGIDMIHVSAGVYASCWAIVPPCYVRHGWTADFAREIRETFHIPVITVGRVNDPRIAESELASGKADFVAMGRASLCDPHMPNKAMNGRFEDIRHCIGCNTGCLGLLFQDIPITCVLNPELGHESEPGISPAAEPRNVMIVGAGPAGMEAAIYAAKAGHRVSVFEAGAQAGGQFLLAAVPPCKGEIADFITWQLTQLKKLGVQIRFNSPVTGDLVRNLAPDVVIMATGASPVVPPIPGADLPHVITANDVLSGRRNVTGSDMVVIGGGQVGTETAHHLAVQLKKVSLVEMLPDIASGEALANHYFLLKALDSYHVRVLTRTRVREITPDSVIVENEEGIRTLPASCVIMAVGSRSCNTLADELKNDGFSVKIIGDARKVGQVSTALQEARQTVKEI